MSETKRVVVTGIGVISPIGNNKEDFFNSLENGKCGIDYITRFDASENKVKIAAEVKDFDVTQYAEKSEARKMDLFTQFAIAAAQQAVEDSQIADKVDSDRFGVYVGSGIGGMGTFVTETGKLIEKGPRRVSPFFVPMMISNMAAGQIAIRHNATGACLPVVTACATSTNAIGEAYRAIKHGYADAIISGGAEAAINQLAMAGFTNCMALSTRNDPSSSSIPFDKRRDGFVMGEGAGIVILEEYEHAKARGAKIYAEVVGYGNTCDAYHVTAPHPDAKGATKAFELAIKESGLTSDMSVYINAHGTSTPLNDKAETIAIKNAFGEMAQKAHISSTKSVTGHMLGATGAIETMACIFALTKDTIPPTVGLEEQDEECDLNYTPQKAVNAKVDIAYSSTFGFGGHNSVLAFKRI